MRTKRIHVYIATALMLAGAVLCWLASAKLEAPYLRAEIRMGGRVETVSLWQGTEGRQYLFLPEAGTELTLRTNAPGRFLLDGAPVSDGDILEEREGWLLTDRETGSEGTLTVVRTGEAALFLDTRSGSMDFIHETRDNAEPGSLRLYDEAGVQNHSGSVESLKGRGNATWWGAEKKPYSLELAAEGDLLGMGAAKKWILLANGTEASQIRNKAVLDFAAEAGLAYTPESRWVDLYLNGEYAGLYLLTERNEIHTRRVNIGTEGTFLISMELESRLVEQGYPHIVTEGKQALRIHDSHVDTETLRSVVQSAENAILARDGVDPVTGKHWTALIDLDSWAEKYLLEEVFANGDGCSISQYFYYDGQKLYAGPAWDYDATMLKLVPQTMYGNRFQACEGKPTPWFHALYQNAEFISRVKQLYAERFRPLLAELVDTGLDGYGRQITASAAANALRWPGTDTDGSRALAIRYMKERMAFLDSLWLEEEAYCFVFVEFGPGINGAYYAVKPGEALPALPVYEDTPQTRYLGWYDMATGEPVDVSLPVYEDGAIFLKQEDLTEEWQSVPEAPAEEPLPQTRLAPALALGAVFAALVLTEVLRDRPGRKKRWP